MNWHSIWNRLVFVLNRCQQTFKSYGLLSRVMHEKRKWRLAIYNYKQPHTNPSVSSMKLKQRIKDSLCYTESIYEEKLSITTVAWKIVYFLHVAPLMPLLYGLKDLPCSTE